LNGADMMEYSLSKQEAYKRYFVCPNASGNWEVQSLCEPYDWRFSILKDDWIKQIAHQTRKISERVNHDVSVMWFVGVDKGIYGCDVFPWFHEEYTINPEQIKLHKKHPNDKIFVIGKSEDINILESNNSWVKYIRIEPQEQELLRNKEQIKRVGNIAQEIGATVILSGGILSHAFYQLLQTGASVECEEVFKANDDEQQFDKLVRDKIPDKIDHSGEISVTKILASDQHMLMLKMKLVEESLEVFDAESETLLEELADVQELIDSIAKKAMISKKQLKDAQKRKLDKVGGFDKGIFLESTRNPLPIDTGDETTSKNLPRHTTNQNTDVSPKLWTDRKLKADREEKITNIRVPVTFDGWQTRMPVLGVSSDTHLNIEGTRKGGELILTISLCAEQYKQLSLFDDE
jgi:predicted house-cleaning noncanonical NTP pyrophosphatase (MazG superfamily)